MVQARTRFGYKVREMVIEVETEVARLIAYVNDTLIPEVRRDSSRGLRAGAEQLGRLAEQLDGKNVRRAGTHAPENPAAGSASASQ